MTDVYSLIGANGSPYSMKMRAVMRYRRLPFIWRIRTSELREKLAHLKPQLVPVLQLPEDGSYHMDSTPLIQMLEARHPGERSVVPEDAGMAFLADLLEDMADEWATKMMFHYRWDAPIDQEYCSRWIIYESFPEFAGDDFVKAANGIRDRQVGRLPLVGCTPQNKPIIEASYLRLLASFSKIVEQRQFLFGGRPSNADFAIFGQLKTLGDDPTPQSVMRREAGLVSNWCRWLDDASGHEGEWRDPSAPLREGTLELLQMVGDTYLPFLIANADAAAAGEAEFELELHGQKYRQGTFGYQVKCLNSLREGYRNLNGDIRKRIDPILQETGCLASLQ
jgi:glutathione S-transferase